MVSRSSSGSFSGRDAPAFTVKLLTLAWCSSSMFQPFPLEFERNQTPWRFFPFFPVPFAPSPAQIGLNQPVALCRSSPVTSALTWNSWAFVSAGATDPASPAYRCWSPTRLRSNVAWAEAEHVGDELVRNRRCDMIIIRIVVLGLDTR